MTTNFRLLFFGLISTYLSTIRIIDASYPYFGTKIGALTQLHHGVSGDVYAVDSRTIFLKNFNYDGEAPAAYFYVGNSKKPSADGWRLRDERGSTSPVIRRYRNKDITLSLPEGKTLRDVKWFSFWCDEFSVNFGDVTIPSNLDFPKPQKISQLNGVHGVSSDNIVIVDAQTLLLPNFSYDGEAPDAKFWVGRGSKPSPQGLRIPDENGKEFPLRRYDKKTIVLTLPGDLTVFDIGHFGVWCEAFTVDFGHIRIPDGLNVPPSLKMLGISPQSKLNCEVLYDDLAFEVRWAVAGESIVVQLVAKLDNGEYMSFGISPNKAHTEMVGADVVVAWVDKNTGKGFAQDYYLDDKSQCSGTRGSCPDTRLEDKTNSIRLLNAAMVNGYSIVTYQRSLKATDKYDLPIQINSTQAIVWAIGPLNQRNEVSFHSKYTKGDQFINFGRQPTWNCPMPEGEPKPSDKDDDDEEVDDADNDEPAEEYYEPRPQKQPQQQQQNNRRPQAEGNRRGQQQQQMQSRPVPTPKPTSKNGAWEIPPIQCFEPEDGVFYAQMGPTGGKHGYPAITGHVGWGISWYINGLLIPEIHVVRGKTYTFVVEGGHNPDIPAKYHPFYITDDPVGGYEYKTEEEKANVQIYAGVHRSRSGKITPTGVGRLCNWTPDENGPSADEYLSFGAYQRTLTLKCDNGEPGIITWTPDRKTPDTVYYHCFTHRHLGWKIHVHDKCDEAQASEIDEVFVEPSEDDIIAESSIRHETKIRPNDNFLLKHEKDLIKHHNMAGIPPKVTFDMTRSSEITKLIADGIRAAEALEESISKNKIPPTELPKIQPASPEALQGEILVSMKNNQTIETDLVEKPQDHLVLPGTGPSVFLRPPSNNNKPNFHSVRIASRRPLPVQIDRRPSPRPVNLPQPSIIINHYRKSIPAIMKPFMNEKPFPIKSIASVLMLGEPTELEPQRHNEPILKTKPIKQSGIIPVPYIDSSPQDSKKKYSIIRNGSTIKGKIPFIRMPQYPEKPLQKPIMYKKPYDEKEIIDIPIDMATYQPAKNTGFQAERVIVESGFRPIVRRKSDNINGTENNENRRQDNAGAEIDDVMETDTLFLSQPQNKNEQYFEPMFIPSPLDSTSHSRNNHKLIDNDDDDNDEDDNTDEEVTAAAAEHLDIYYLPPDTKKRPGFSSSSVPDGAVVTYDGKAVLDTSLINISPPKLPFNNNNNDRKLIKSKSISKTEQLVRTPQFAPFKGEMPPPVPDFLPKDAPQNNLKYKSQQKPITEYSNPLTNSTNPISTKLTLLKPISS